MNEYQKKRMVNFLLDWLWALFLIQRFVSVIPNIRISVSKQIIRFFRLSQNVIII